ncbi:MAG: enoyl-CoA hydratase-related protein [Acidiferrobacterales bacterium]|nr:enoyl-CoA hydratase-related protein [Acidiferrobacterales bacterium]
MNQPLLLTIDDRGVCTLTLHRPDRHNAFDDRLVKLLLQKLEEIEYDPAIRVVIFTGTGKSFSSGADLEWMRAMAKYNEESNREDARRVAELMERLNTLSKPTVARVNGPAFAGAIGLIACCDIVIASERAEFAISEVRLGLAPAVISPYVIAAIGARQARRLFLTAERISSGEARRIGLVHEVVSDEMLAEAVEKQVQYLLKAGPKALTECKRLILHVTEREDVAEETADVIARLRVSDEGQEGMTAFFEKRKPKWVK